MDLHRISNTVIQKVKDKPIILLFKSFSMVIHEYIYTDKKMNIHKLYSVHVLTKFRVEGIIKTKQFCKG